MELFGYRENLLEFYTEAGPQHLMFSWFPGTILSLLSISDFEFGEHPISRLKTRHLQKGASLSVDKMRGALSTVYLRLPKPPPSPNTPLLVVRALELFNVGLKLSTREELSEIVSYVDGVYLSRRAGRKTVSWPFPLAKLYRGMYRFANTLESNSCLSRGSAGGGGGL